MAPVTEETERTERTQPVPDDRIEIIGGTKMPPETVQNVFDGLKQLLPHLVPKPKTEDEKDKNDDKPPVWMAVDATDQAAALELFYHVQDANYPLTVHVDRLQKLGLTLHKPPRASQLSKPQPSPQHVRAIILAALYLDKGELRLRDPRVQAPSA